jgi:hypothetical protein
MALDNAQLKDFCNSDLRQLADVLLKAKIKIDTASAVYLQRNLGTIINDGGSSNFVIDGSQEDGRTKVTGGDVYNIITLLTGIKTFLEAESRMDVVYKWQVNGNT